MKLKNFIRTIVSFGMSDQIKLYRNADKKNREFIKMDIENIKINKPPRSKNKILSIFLILTIIIFSFLVIPMILDNSLRYENKYLFSIMFLSLAGLIAMGFKTLQCNYILKRFEEIDNEDKLQDDSLKQRIVACNLYLK